MKRIINWIKHKEETEEDVYTRWEKDFDLIPLDKHGLFSEYLELGELGRTTEEHNNYYNNIPYSRKIWWGIKFGRLVDQPASRQIKFR